MKEITSSLSSESTDSDVGNREPQRDVASAAHKVAKLGADVAVEIIDSAPAIAKTASAFSNSLPFKNVWMRHGLAVALLGVVAFSVLAVGSLKNDDVDSE